jgi:hypothetical protein
LSAKVVPGPLIILREWSKNVIIMPFFSLATLLATVVGTATKAGSPSKKQSTSPGKKKSSSPFKKDLTSISISTKKKWPKPHTS